MHSRLIAALLFLGFLPTAAAQIPNPSLHIGVFGGYHLLDSDADFGDHDLVPLRKLESGPDFGVRLGLNITWLVGVEVEFEDAIVENTVTGDSVHLLSGKALAVFHWLEHSEVVLPFALAGVGFYRLLADDPGNDVDFFFTYGVGVKFMLADEVAFRIQVNHLLDGDALEGEVANNFDVTGGFDFFAWGGREEPPPPPPDRDGDGLLDSEDRCPDDAGLIAYRGCPDRDKDGIADIDDQCPYEPGVQSLQGCPDTDGDGIADSKDKCPKQPGLVEYDGCPDTDGDTIPDPQDKCPQTPGVPEEQGCPAKPKEEVLKKFSGAIRGIQFDTGKATIRKQSFPTLDEAVQVLAEFPLITLIVEGHTDDRGSDVKNLKLSQDRADSVKQYFVAKGIAADRLTAIGYGETKPVAPNKTEAGRQENRRIEFKLIQPNIP
ncbi:MAG: hypothetical protein AMXMBFR64_08490 [Myxococcales bacterium]